MRADQHPPLLAVQDAVSRALAEDLLPLGDLTGSLIPTDRVATADFKARADGTVAGRLCVAETFMQLDPSVKLSWFVDDGEEVARDNVLCTVEGPLPSILAGERTALNFLCHLSGIATTTKRFVRAAHGNSRIRDTRKTTPGLRALEKAAVRAGGGVNHRGSLSDGILVKDNHLGGLSIGEAIRRAKLRWPGRAVEVECDSLAQVLEAISEGADLVLLDNMSVEQVRNVFEGIGGKVALEVSGGVTLANVGAYAETGVDFVAVGMLTHSAPILDIGLDIRAG